MGSLPNFLVIGASRSGTTSLHHYLGQHPEIFMCPVKSPNFFASADEIPARETGALRSMAKQWIRDVDEYESLFDGVGEERAVGEVSPVYMQTTCAPRRIAAASPEARLVAILRDPSERAFAHYQGRRRDGLERRASFEAVVEEELAEPLPDSVSFGHYLGCGRYHHFLSEYYRHFPPDRIRIHLFEDFVQDPSRVLADLCDFLGVGEFSGFETTTRHNVTGQIRNPLLRACWTASVGVRTRIRPLLPERLRRAAGRPFLREINRPELSEEMRSRLVEVFRSDIESLQELIGRDLSSWLESARSRGATA